MQQMKQIARHRDAVRPSSVLQRWVSQACMFAVLSLGFAQVSQAGVISTYELGQAEQRTDRQAQLQDFLARADVAAELERFGVSAADVMARVQNLTDAEILALQGRIEEQVAGGDALAVIGVVFLVLLILEVVGVTDIFKSV